MDRRLLLVPGVALLLFAPTLRHGFAYDDSITVLENPLVREERFADILLAPYHAGPSQRIPTGLWRPVTTWTFAAQHAVHGISPAGYHAANVLLHAAVAALVAALALEVVRSLGRRGREAGTAALAAGLLFAVHPVHVEAVANVSGRAELVSAAFGLSALLAYARLRRADGETTLVGSGLAAALFLLACLAKEGAVTLAAGFVAWEALRGGRRAAVVRATLLAALAVGLFLAMRLAIVGSLTLRDDAVTFLENPVVGQTLPVRWMTALAVAGRATGLLVFPLELTPDYGFAHLEPAGRLLAPAVLAGVAALGAALLAIARLRRRRGDVVFGLVLLLAPWLLVSNLFVTIGTIFGERLLYLPSAGFALVVGAGTASLVARFRRAPIVAAAALVLLLGAWRSVTYAAVWKDDLTLFTAAERVAPRSVRVLVNLGVELALRGRYEEAEAHLVRARDLAPWVVPVRMNLAEVYRKLGRLDDAKREREGTFRF